MSKHEAELHFEALETARNQAYIDSLKLDGIEVLPVKQRVLDIEAEMQKHAWLHDLTDRLYVVG